MSTKVLLFRNASILAKQDTKQDVQTPCLHPGDFFDAHNSINQATVP
jgi:hypothetical protein